MATFEFVDGKRVLKYRTLVAGRDNLKPLPKDKSADPKAAKAKSKKDEVKT